MKRDIKTFRGVCRKYGMSDDERYEFSAYIQHLKETGHGGSGQRGDFTFAELCRLAEEFLGGTDGNGDNNGNGT